MHDPNTHNLKLTLAYDGTEYVGWQRQRTGRSIQGALEAALAELEGAPVTVAGAGRTDAGVHALAQVASVRLQCGLGPPVLARALNAKLPADIRVVDAAVADPDFHARFSARGKTYRYALRYGGVGDPFALRYAWHVAAPLDVPAMRAAGARLCGRRDFAAFQSAGSSVRTSVRTVSALTVREPAPRPLGGGGEDAAGVLGAVFGAGGAVFEADGAAASALTIEIEADGFLRHMVRAIVGTLVEVGRGRRAPDDMAGILASGRRERAGPTAPARGLFLARVAFRDA